MRPCPTAVGVHLDGIASVVRAHGTAESFHDGDIVHPGDEIEVTSGTLVLELAAGGTVEARAGYDGAADSLFEVGAPVRLLAGDLLAAGPSGVAVDAAGTLVTLEGDDDGAARLLGPRRDHGDRGFGVGRLGRRATRRAGTARAQRRRRGPTAERASSRSAPTRPTRGPPLPG